MPAARLRSTPARRACGWEEWYGSRKSSGFGPPISMRAGAPAGMAAAAVPISTGEDTLHARITVAFEIAK